MSSPQLTFRHWLPVLLIGAGLMILPLYLVLDHRPLSDIADIKEAGKLRVITIDGPTTYYQTPDGPSGFEYDLLTAFAKKLGVRLQLEVADSLASVFPRLLRGDASFAAAALSVTPSRKQLVRFSQPYQTISTDVIYRRGDLRPRSIRDLVGRRVVVPAGSPYAQLLRMSQTKYPALRWTETSSETPADLLDDVWQQHIDVTFAPSNLFTIVRPFQPDLKVGFTLSSKSRLAWAFPPDADESLIGAANEFLEHIRQSGELARLIDRYYGPASKFDYVNVKTFRERIATILPRYEQLFKRAAAQNNLDWRLLAAQSYQESYWKPGAVSPTGVRGLMQITEATADLIQLTDRTNPRQSVQGGARYLRDILKHIGASVPEPDRTWFALAAYNIGLGHLQDAEQLARDQHKNPNRWSDLKTTLELLTDPTWYKKTKYGYARGNEAVAYVTRIRTFYDILSKLESDPLKSRAMKIEVPAL